VHGLPLLANAGQRKKIGSRRFAVAIQCRERRSMRLDTEHALKPCVSYAVLSAFALANAGVPPIAYRRRTLQFRSRRAWGPRITARLGIAERQAGSTLARLYGISVLTGVGFTMSLVIGALAFEDGSVIAQIRLSGLVGSALSGVLVALAPLAASRARARVDQGPCRTPLVG